jgi:hypothetical protein
MNERIKLLAEQANIRFGRMAILDGDPRGMARFVSYSEFEKFAELLISECMAVTVNYPHPQTKLTAAEHIARHFGVSE